MVQLLPCGDRALLIDLEDPGRRRAVARGLRQRPPSGLNDWAVGMTTILVTADTPASLPGLARELRLLAAHPETGTGHAEATVADVLEVPVVYDGPDLDAVAEELATSREAVIARHCGQEWEVDFTGFAPGFGYLLGDAGGLDVARLASPRTRVPAGALGCAGPFCGIYPSASPGGWRLIGHTTSRMWDAVRDPPALLVPGRRVRFIRTRAPQIPRAAGAASPATTAAAVRHDHPTSTGRALTVEATGALATLQDLGRPGHRDVGVTPGGALDRAALRLANRLVGNAVDATGLEVLLGGLAVRAGAPVTVAATGAPAPVLVQGRPVAFGAPVLLAAGELLQLGRPAAGLRSYLAVNGGLVADRLYGSCSSSPTLGLGPRPLQAGDRLPVGEPTGLPPREGLGPLAARPDGAEVVVRVVLGPRADWVADTDRRALFTTSWQVTSDTDRVGARLAGPGLHRAGRHRGSELASEPMVRGAIQVPTDGQPIVFLADHPTTGGYPVVAVVVDADVDLVAQRPPGSRVRFIPVAPPSR